MSASNPATPEPSEIAGRFQVVKKLGAGAFGTVYKAKDKVLGRMLAIKTIRLEGLAASQAGLAEMLERFQREARVAAQLKHPNIVTIYDIGDADGMSYISMEFIDGVGLDRMISEAGRMPIERVAALAAQVADGLDYAHRHGVVHRDIKPANIMVEPGDRVKVTDFGIAKPGDSAEHLTMTGSLLGTPSYMSPEQARGQKLDGRSDLFSLGCVIYEMVAGRKAFRGDSITALLFKIIAEEPQPIQELEPTVPEAMVRLLQKAIAKSPEARYQTGREMEDDLLAMTRVGAVPTLRAIDTPTIAPEHAPTISGAPTIAGTPTAVSPVTLSGATSSTQPAAQSPAPTVLTPGTATTPGLPPPVPPAPAAAARPAARAAQPQARPAKGGGSGLGLVLGLVAVAFLLLVMAAGGAWWFFSRRQAPLPSASPTPVAEAASPTPVAEAASPTPPATEPVAPTASAVPGASGPTPAAVAVTTPPPTVTAHASPPVQREERHRVATVTPPSAPSQAPQQPLQGDVAPAVPGDYGFLNDIPAQGPDGRQLGEALANTYRSGGSSGITGRRFAARPRVPRDVAPSERPAVATLLHLMFMEHAYQRQHGRYGNLHELRAAGLLRLDVPFAKGQFERARYRFELSHSDSEYKVTATPLVQGARPFVVDDNGFVRVDE